MLQCYQANWYGPNGLFKNAIVFTVAEGNVNSERLIQMMTVVDDVLVIEEKGIFCWKILMSRQFDVCRPIYTKQV
jgi:hypothetical protein